MIFPEMQDKEEVANENLESQERIEISKETLVNIETKIDTLIDMMKTLEVNTNETKE